MPRSIYDLFEWVTQEGNGPMLAKDIMTPNVITVKPDTTVREIANLLIGRRISAVPVLDDDNRLIGIVSEGDLVHRVKGDHELPRSWWLNLIGNSNDTAGEYLKSHGSKATDVMTRNVVTVTEQASIAEIADLLEKRRIKRVPVVGGDGSLVGIVSRANVIQALASQGASGGMGGSADDAEIREQILQDVKSHLWAHESAINIIVSDGVVSYWGVVESEEARRALTLAAERVTGVKAVEDNMGIGRMANEYM